MKTVAKWIGIAALGALALLDLSSLSAWFVVDATCLTLALGHDDE